MIGTYEFGRTVMLSSQILSRDKGTPSPEPDFKVKVVAVGGGLLARGTRATCCIETDVRLRETERHWNVAEGE